MVLSRVKLWTSFLLCAVIFVLTIAGAAPAQDHSGKALMLPGHSAPVVPSRAGGAVLNLAGKATASSASLSRAAAGGAYTVSFTETGLPFGNGVPDNGPNITWTVDLGSLIGQSTATSASSSINFTGIANGTYPYNIPGVTSNFGVNSSTPSFGNVSVNGADVSFDVSFSYSRTYPVTFIAVGLPQGANWSATFNGATLYAFPVANTINFGGNNGSYRYSISSVSGYRANAYHGLATVKGAWLNITVTWTQLLYSVTFNETGLKPDNQWGVGLSPPRPPTNVTGGGTKNSTGASITFPVSNGTFSFTIDGSSSYLATPESGTIIVAGAPVNVEITFVMPPPGHKWITFSESGLPLGSSWEVVLNGSPVESANQTIAFSEPNGTYRVSISAGGGWGPNPANLTVSVPGDTGPFTIYFLPVYPVEFSESNLPQGTNWSVSVTGNASESVLVAGHLFGGSSTTVTRWSDGGSTIRVYLSNGTYSYTSSAPGQSGTGAPLTVTGGSPAPVSLTFHPNPSSGTILGQPYWVFVTLGAIALAVIVGIALVFRRRKTRPTTIPEAGSEDSTTVGKDR
jgi:hypothetical protein